MESQIEGETDNKGLRVWGRTEAVNEIPTETKTNTTLRVGDEVINRAETRVTSRTTLRPSSPRGSSYEAASWPDLDASYEARRQSVASS
jgi:hypothetical protein